MDVASGVAFDRLVVQVGGGALASACVHALGEGVELGALAARPRIDTVQTEGAWPLRRAFDAVGTRGEAEQGLREGQFPEGSMGPKIEAIISFLERGGQRALITNPENISRALAGKTGTWIVP